MRKRSLVFFLICFLIFLPNLAPATQDAEAIREIIKAQVMINTTCMLTVSSVTGEVLLKLPSSEIGNGFFIEHALPNIVMTAGHVVDCRPTADMLERIKNSVGSAIAFTVLVDSTISVVYDGKEYPAKVLKSSFDTGKPDYAVLLSANISDAVEHGRLPTLTEEGVYGVGDEVLLSGLMPLGESLEPYLKKALIAKIDNRQVQLFQFSEPIYKGMSGSPVALYREGKYRAIGVLIIGGFTDVFGTNISVDLARATKIKKEFLEIDPKTVPAK